MKPTYFYKDATRVYWSVFVKKISAISSGYICTFVTSLDDYPMNFSEGNIVACTKIVHLGGPPNVSAVFSSLAAHFAKISCEMTAHYMENETAP